MGFIENLLINPILNNSKSFRLIASSKFVKSLECTLGKEWHLSEGLKTFVYDVTIWWRDEGCYTSQTLCMQNCYLS